MLFAGSSKTAHRILIFSIAMDADNSFYVKSIATYAPIFFGYIISVLAIVDCDSERLLCIYKAKSTVFYWNSYHNMIQSNLNKVDSQEFLKQMTSAIDSLHLCISCLQVCKVFIEEVLAQKPCMYGNKFRLNLCIRFITHSGSIGHKNRKCKYKNEALNNFIIRL